MGGMRLKIGSHGPGVLESVINYDNDRFPTSSASARLSDHLVVLSQNNI